MGQPNKQDVETGLARIKQTFANQKARQMIAEVLPAVARKYLTPERITKIVLTAASRNPLLAVCTPQSVLRAIMEVAPLGLEIGGPQGHVYLVPFFNKYIGAYEAVPIPGYMGYIASAYRGKVAQSICADVVYEGDVFKYVRHADSDEFVHEKTHKSDKIIGFYCRAIYHGGGGHIEFMYLDEVDAVRQRSRAKDAGPWTTDYVAMGKKTVVRRARKFWPQNWELANLAELDDRVDTGEYIDGGKVIDVTPQEPEKPTTDALADKLLGDRKEREEDRGVPVTGNGTGATADVIDDELPPEMRPPETEPEAPPSAKGYKHVGDDAKKVEFIWTALLDDASGDTGKAAQTLAMLTEFTGKDDGKLVPGVTRFEDLSPKRLDILYGKVKKMLKDAEAKGAKKPKAAGKDGDLPFK